jgi:two-component system, sensor histidine kinase and response regulator
MATGGQPESEGTGHGALPGGEVVNRATNEFLSRVSHEMRTPLHGIISAAALLANSALTQEQREVLALIDASANLLLATVNDIVDLADLHARMLQLEEGVFDLGETLERVVATQAQSAQGKGLELVGTVRPDTPLRLVGDGQRLHQVLIKLVDNAVKFTDKGEVAVSVETQAEMGSEVELHFKVRDTGIGVPEERRDDIFEPFRQGDGSTTRRYGGAGLGLALAQRLVRLMGGHIWVESQLGAGSTFHFTARLHRQARSGAATAYSKVAAWEGQRALVIDDNETSRQALREVLSGWGLTVHEASNALQGLQRIEEARESGQAWRMILLDSAMPRMDGFTAAGWLRDDAAMRDAVIMMLPMGNIAKDTARCREVGISSHLVKPIKPSELREAVAKLLGTAQEEVEHEASAVRAAGPGEAVAGAGTGLRVLLVEDNASIQWIGRKTLEEAGHTVQLARNGIEALQKTEQGQFDVILMDVEMPQMDGLEATRMIRQREVGRGQRVPIMAMTAYATQGDRTRCLEAGMDGCLIKPFTPHKLYEVLAQLQSRRPPEGGGVHFDVEAGLQAAGGSEEFLREGVRVLMEEDYPRHLAQLRVGVSRGDGQVIRAAAHGLKGTLGSFGGMAARDIAQRLEAMADTGNLTGAPGMIEELVAEVQRFAACFAQAEREGFTSGIARGSEKDDMERRRDGEEAHPAGG